jgi:hypothetical protein
MKQDLAEVEAQVESKTRYEPDPDFSPPPDDAWFPGARPEFHHQDTKTRRGQRTPPPGGDPLS